MEAQAPTQTQITPEFARQWADRFVSAWNSHDPERLLSLVTDDVVWEDPFITPDGRLEGKPPLRAWLESVWRSMPDLEFSVIGEPCISLDGTRVMAAWKGGGRMTGPLDPPGFAPTGGRVEMTGVDAHEFRGDLLRRVWTITDLNAIAVQIGAAPPPGSLGERLGIFMQKLMARRLRRKAGG